MLATVGISIPEEDDDEVERFREFLDTISADDFAGSEGGAGSEDGEADSDRLVRCRSTGANSQPEVDGYFSVRTRRAALTGTVSAAYLR